MQPETFRAAKLNALRIGSYDTPHLTNPPVQEWLMAALSGPGGVFLMISDRATRWMPMQRWRQMIKADKTRSWRNSPKTAQTRFSFGWNIICRRPLQSPVSFLRQRAFAHWARAVNSLAAVGRYANSRGSIDDQAVLQDIPHPAPNAEGALNWHCAAEDRPWVGEG